MKCRSVLRFIVNLDVVMAVPVLYPHYGALASSSLVLVFVLLNLPWVSRRVVAAEERFRRSVAFQIPLLALTSVLVALGSLETIGQVATRAGWVEPFTPMEAVRFGSDDFRLYHVVLDDLMEPDSELLWRPRARSPYNSQRFKGAIVETPKPAGVFRILCLGDSNTDGPPTDGWPSHLEKALRERSAGEPGVFEVINAGVAGYSSWQGLRRFERLVDVFEPDLVFVSFGGNDGAASLSRPDREFERPSALARWIYRRLVPYRFFVSGLTLLARDEETSEGSVEPRVSVSDYVENLEAFAKETARRGGEVVFLTRAFFPVPVADLPRSAFTEIPRYNQALLDLAARTGSYALDVHQFFRLHHPDDFVDQTHFDYLGREAMARFLAEWLEESSLLRRER